MVPSSVPKHVAPVHPTPCSPTHILKYALDLLQHTDLLLFILPDHGKGAKVTYIHENANATIYQR